MSLSNVLRWSLVTMCLLPVMTLSAVSREVGPGQPLVIPITDVLGGTDVKNNAKNNPNGGYFSVYDAITQFQYPATHGNQLGNTALVNDHTYWDSAPGGLDATHAPPPDPGGGSALWWPIPGEWTSYQFTVTTAGTYCVLTRFSASWGPGQAAQVSVTIDGTSSGPVPLAPDDAKLWSDTHYQVGGWWGHTMVSGTCPVAWALGAGTHVMKFQIERFPEKPTDHGNVWIHYLKVMHVAQAPKPPTAVLKPVVLRQLAAAMAALKQAEEHDKKGRLGQALTAYEKAVSGLPADGEAYTRAASRATELRQAGEQRLAAAKAMPPAEAATALALVATEFSGCDIGVSASKLTGAMVPAAGASSASSAVGGTWTPPTKEAAIDTLKHLIITTTAKKPVEVQMTLFGKPQQVVVTGGDDRAMVVKFAGSTAGLEWLWERITFSDLANLGRACIGSRAAEALSVGEASVALGQKPLAEEVLHLAARLDPTLAAAVAERLTANAAR